YKRYKIRHVDARAPAEHRHRQLVAKHLRAGATQPRQAQVLAHERRSHDVKLLEGNHSIDLHLAREKRQQIDEKRWPGIIGNGDHIVETLARPVFPEHLLFRDQNDATAVSFAFANEISAFEIRGEANYVERAILSFRHFRFSLFRVLIMLLS